MIDMIDVSKFLINNRPAPSTELPPEYQPFYERTQPGEPLPDIVVTFNPPDFRQVERAHKTEMGLYRGLRAVLTEQNLYLLDISVRRYEEQVKYCSKSEWSTIVESWFDPTDVFYNTREWAGKWGWVILDFLKQVENWNKC